MADRNSIGNCWVRKAFVMSRRQCSVWGVQIEKEGVQYARLVLHFLILFLSTSTGHYPFLF